MSRDCSAGGLAWREAGDGPAIVFLHGLGGTRTAWDAQLESLSTERRCVAWDMPGYGDSTALPLLDFDTITASISRLFDLLGLDRADLVGLSFGGQQALHFTLAHPERVRRLILADTSHRFGDDGTDPDEWKRARLSPLDQGATPADIAEQVIDAISAPGFTGAERERAIEAFRRIPSSGLRAAVECLPTHDVSDRLGEIGCPTLVVVGELDEETPVAYAEAIAAGIVGARLAVIPGAGHLTPLESPAQFNALLNEFLADRTRQWNGR